MYMEYKYSCWINSKNYKLAKSMNKKVETSSVEQGCQYKARGTEFPPPKDSNLARSMAFEDFRL